MPVSALTNDGTGSYPAMQADRQDKQGAKFAQMLRQTQQGPVDSAQPTLSQLQSLDRGMETAPKVSLGTIGPDTPTVSHILKNNSDFADETWKIILSDQNKSKPYTRMREGTQVYIDSSSKELSWKHPLSSSSPQISNVAKSSLEVSPMASSDPEVHASLEKPLVLGTISKENPTVSHLFQNNGKYKGNYWNIILSPQNSDIPFNKLQDGTVVTLDPTSMTLQVGKGDQGQPVMASPATIVARPAKVLPPQATGVPEVNDEPEITQGKSFSERMDDSVRPYLGRPYKEIDCYGLVVRGIMNQGVKYQGHGGLRQNLESLAKEQGLPANSFLSGEGLVEQAGTTVFSKTIPKIGNSSIRAEKVFEEMQGFLEKGQVLSFSTPTRGHTGIVSQKGGDWTYINSGLMDNNLLAPGRVTKSVGEETLSKEVKNWCSLAASRKESLKVTVGSLDEEKLRSLSMGRRPMGEEVTRL